MTKYPNGHGRCHVTHFSNFGASIIHFGMGESTGISDLMRWLIRSTSALQVTACMKG